MVEITIKEMKNKTESDRYGWKVEWMKNRTVYSAGKIFAEPAE